MMRYIKVLILALLLTTSGFAKGTGSHSVSSRSSGSKASRKSTGAKSEAGAPRARTTASTAHNNKSEVKVKGYQRRDGKTVKGYSRTAGNKTQKDNYST